MVKQKNTYAFSAANFANHLPDDKVVDGRIDVEHDQLAQVQAPACVQQEPRRQLQLVEDRDGPLEVLLVRVSDVGDSAVQPGETHQQPDLVNEAGTAKQRNQVPFEKVPRQVFHKQLEPVGRFRDELRRTDESLAVHLQSSVVEATPKHGHFHWFYL